MDKSLSNDRPIKGTHARVYRCGVSSGRGCRVQVAQGDNDLWSDCSGITRQGKEALTHLDDSAPGGVLFPVGFWWSGFG